MNGGISKETRRAGPKNAHLEVVEKDLLMKRFALTAGPLVLLIAATGCKRQLGDNDAIRSGIMQHLTAVGTLNISAMVMGIRIQTEERQSNREVDEIVDSVTSA
jgi:hypothetical protein